MNYAITFTNRSDQSNPSNRSNPSTKGPQLAQSHGQRQRQNGEHSVGRRRRSPRHSVAVVPIVARLALVVVHAPVILAHDFVLTVRASGAPYSRRVKVGEIENELVIGRYSGLSRRCSNSRDYLRIFAYYKYCWF